MMPPKFLGFSNVVDGEPGDGSNDPTDVFARAPAVATVDERAHPHRLLSSGDDATALVRKRLLVRTANGTILEWHGTEPIPADATIVAGDDDGTHRARLAAFERTAHELVPGDYRTGRRVWIDGEGAHAEVRSDAEVWRRVPK